MLHTCAVRQMNTTPHYWTATQRAAHDPDPVSHETLRDPSDQGRTDAVRSEVGSGDHLVMGEWA